MTTDPKKYLDGIVHAETQSEGRGFDLTLADVRRVERPGRIDFGGGELVSAKTKPIETDLRDPEDDYGWWDVDGGQYLLVYNESLVADMIVQLQPRDELVVRGAFHPTLRVAELGPIPLSVPDGGIRLKENARVTTLLLD